MSYDESLDSLTFPKEKEVEILNLFETEKVKPIKKRLWREQGITNSKFAKPLYTPEKNIIKIGYEVERITLQQLLNLLAMMDFTFSIQQ